MLRDHTQKPSMSNPFLKVTANEITDLMTQLMMENYFSDEMLFLENVHENPFEFHKYTAQFLCKLGWKELNDEAEFRFLTALYAKIGCSDDVSAYLSIKRWMQDVGINLHGPDFSKEFVADGIDAIELYECYYSYSNVTGYDLIPSVDDPETHNWKKEGRARPMLQFQEWLLRNPKAYDDNLPLNLSLLTNLKA